MALRGEESAWFGQCYLGSRALFGQLTKTDIERPHRTSGKTLKSYMQGVSANIEKIVSGEPLMNASSIAAYLELHIEQGPVLDLLALAIRAVQKEG